MDEKKENLFNPYGSAADAENLAGQIREFWALKGHLVRVWVTRKEASRKDHYAYDVRSNLLNGLPRA